MKIKALLDIDGVIADFYLGFGNYLNKNIGTNLNLDNEQLEYSIYNWDHDLPQHIIDEEIPKWILNGGYANIPIIKGAKQFVYKLMDKYDVYIVTARVGDFTLKMPGNIQDIIIKDTFKWFKKHGIPSDKLFFECKKVDFCKKYNIPIMIEDKLSTVIDAANNGIRAILMDRNWNQDDSIRENHYNIFVVYNYNDIFKILELLTNES